MKPIGLRRFFLSLVTIIFLLSTHGTSISADPSPIIATVQKVSGMATVLRQGQTLSVKIDLEIYQNDTLRTGPDGSLGVIFRDDTLLSMGPNSVLVIDEFVFAPKQGKFSIVIRMLKGTAAYLSGLISKLAPESAHFKTPTASIGIRGTKFVARVEGGE
ncbi:MAG: putative exported protein [Deltaproteobacteria bacterium]|jgi:hypothetical protein|nr:putative exported protein [Deltaproteobacteria bacterium]